MSVHFAVTFIAIAENTAKNLLVYFLLHPV